MDAYILYATGEEHTESSREDAIEALIGAVAMDCDWNWDVLEAAVSGAVEGIPAVTIARNVMNAIKERN